MKLKIEISLDNAAFEDNGVSEVQSICNRILNQLEETEFPEEGHRAIFDTNWNTVGFWEISDD